MDFIADLYTDGDTGILSVQLISDIHLESRPLGFEVAPVAPVIALLGDIGYASSTDGEGDKLASFFNKLSQKFQYVLYVAGNHEYWHTREGGDDFIKRMCEEIGNVYYLNRKSIKINNFAICGATLWTRVPRGLWRDAWGCMRDFDLIEELKCSRADYEVGLRAYLEWHTADAEWLRQQIEATSMTHDDIVILTHHAPSSEGTISPDDFDTFGDVAKCMTSSNLEAMLEPHVTVWAFGHTHYNCRRFITHSVRSDDTRAEECRAAVVVADGGDTAPPAAAAGDSKGGERSTLIISNQIGDKLQTPAYGYNPTLRVVLKRKCDAAIDASVQLSI